MYANVRVGITKCRETYRKSNIMRKRASFFLHDVHVFEPLGSQLGTKSGRNVEIIYNLEFYRGDFEHFEFVQNGDHFYVILLPFL